MPRIPDEHRGFASSGLESTCSCRLPGCSGADMESTTTSRQRARQRGKPERAIHGGEQSPGSPCMLALPPGPICAGCAADVWWPAPTKSATMPGFLFGERLRVASLSWPGESRGHVSKNLYCTDRSTGHRHALSLQFRSRSHHMQALQHDPLLLVSTK